MGLVTRRDDLRFPKLAVLRGGAAASLAMPVRRTQGGYEPCGSSEPATGNWLHETASLRGRSPRLQDGRVEFFRYPGGRRARMLPGGPGPVCFTAMPDLILYMALCGGLGAKDRSCSPPSPTTA
jgi:hypothetical protein